MKNFLAVLAVVLTFISYIPYVKDTLARKTTPHIYTWLIWGFVTLIAFALQVKGGAGLGSLIALTSGSLALAVALIGFILIKDRQGIDRINTGCFVLAMLALLVWVLVHEADAAIILVTAADILGFIPTVRKSWNHPEQETLFLYGLTTFRFALVLFALKNYNLLTLLYPFTWMLANGFFSLFLILRRRQLAA